MYVIVITVQLVNCYLILRFKKVFVYLKVSVIEEDLLDKRDVPAEVYYGMHGLRAIENFYISDRYINHIPEFISGIVMVKKQQSIMANKELKTIYQKQPDAIINFCDKILNNGKCMDQFPVDIFQGGAGTSLKYEY